MVFCATQAYLPPVIVTPLLLDTCYVCVARPYRYEIGRRVLFHNCLRDFRFSFC